MLSMTWIFFGAGARKIQGKPKRIHAQKKKKKKWSGVFVLEYIFEHRMYHKLFISDVTWKEQEKGAQLSSL